MEQSLLFDLYKAFDKMKSSHKSYFFSVRFNRVLDQSNYFVEPKGSN